MKKKIIKYFFIAVAVLTIPILTADYLKKNLIQTCDIEFIKNELDRRGKSCEEYFLKGQEVFIKEI
tara:strand:+ start:112 stop:309 length:198 start_codon:yes stop_codon:yes gene_type:complete